VIVAYVPLLETMRITPHQSYYPIEQAAIRQKSERPLFAPVPFLLPFLLPEDASFPKQAYEEFYEKHLVSWNKRFADAVMAEARIPFYKAVARVLAHLSE
jgi:hypothetical protein